MGDIEADNAGNSDELERREDESGISLPQPLLDEIFENPLAIPKVIAVAAVERWGKEALKYAERVRAEHPHATARQLAQMVRYREVRLAAGVGAFAGLPVSLLHGNPVVSASPSLLLLWIQSRMVVHIAALYGRDTSSPEMVKDLLSLQAPHAVTAEPARRWLSAGSMRYAKRSINKRLKGETLVKAKQGFGRVDMNFSRAGVLRTLPYLAVPVSSGVNATTTLILANRAISYYDAETRFLQPTADGDAS